MFVEGRTLCNSDRRLRMTLHTSYICSTPELSERKFRNGLEMMFTSSLGGIKQTSWLTR